MKKRIGVLLSGRVSNFEALADSVVSGRIPNAEIAVVLSNQKAAAGIERAKSRGLSTQVIPSKGLEREAYDRSRLPRLDAPGNSVHPDLKSWNIAGGRPDSPSSKWTKLASV